MRFFFLAPAVLVASLFSASAKVHQIFPPYPHDALEPYITANALEQHLALHAWYVQRTNELIAGTVLNKLPLQAVVLTAPYKSELYNMSAQAYNHNFEWQILAPPGQGGGGAPRGKLGLHIDRNFGSLQGLKEAFLKESRPVFASGYVSLVKRICDGELVVVANGDADDPLRLGQGVPIVSLDLWEHSYVLLPLIGIYRDKYILDSFNIIDWHQAEKIYDGDLSILLN